MSDNIIRLFIFAIVIMTGIGAASDDVFSRQIKYGDNNRVEDVIYSDGTSVKYVYDVNGNIISVSVENGEVSGNKPQEDEDKKGDDPHADDESKKEDDDKSDDNSKKEEGGQINDDSGREDPSHAHEVETDKSNGASGGLNAGKILVAKSGSYKVTSDGSVKTAAYIKPKNKKVKTVTIPDSITYKGIKYSITRIEAKAFYGCKKLKKIVIKTKKLKSVGKKAFGNTHKKLVIKVPKSKLNTYKKLLRGKGQSKKAKIKK